MTAATVSSTDGAEDMAWVTTEPAVIDVLTPAEQAIYLPFPDAEF